MSNKIKLNGKRMNFWESQTYLIKFAKMSEEERTMCREDPDYWRALEKYTHFDFPLKRDVYTKELVDELLNIESMHEDLKTLSVILKND